MNNCCCCAVSLSFGALAINDVVAAALTVSFCEVRTGRHRSLSCDPSVYEHLLEPPMLGMTCSSTGRFGHELRQLQCCTTRETFFDILLAAGGLCAILRNAPARLEAALCKLLQGGHHLRTDGRCLQAGRIGGQVCLMSSMHAICEIWKAPCTTGL